MKLILKYNNKYLWFNKTYFLTLLGYFSSILCLMISIYKFSFLLLREFRFLSRNCIINEVVFFFFLIVLLRISGIASSDRQSFLFSALIYVSVRWGEWETAPLSRNLLSQGVLVFEWQMAHYFWGMVVMGHCELHNSYVLISLIKLKNLKVILSL